MKKKRYFRNIAEIDINGTIDPECLWEKDNDWLILVDDDEYIVVAYSDHKEQFREVFDQN